MMNLKKKKDNIKIFVMQIQIFCNHFQKMLTVRKISIVFKYKISWNRQEKCQTQDTNRRWMWTHRSKKEKETKTDKPKTSFLIQGEQRNEMIINATSGLSKSSNSTSWSAWARETPLQRGSQAAETLCTPAGQPSTGASHETPVPWGPTATNSVYKVIKLQTSTRLRS